MIVIGTRPELIKMAILYKLLSQSSSFRPMLCLTGQHDSLIEVVMTSLDESDGKCS